MIAHAAPRDTGKAVLGASYDHRLLSGFDVTQVLQMLLKPPARYYSDDDHEPGQRQIKRAIRAKVIELARALTSTPRHHGHRRHPRDGLSRLDGDPRTDRVVRTSLRFPAQQKDVNVDNLGSIDAMTDFLLARKTA